MALPPLIEVVPFDHPVTATVAMPGSKSITNRALILAALAKGEVTLRGALWSEDTQVMVDSLRRLGFAVTVAEDPRETANRFITVQGLGGQVPGGGTAEHPVELSVGNSGTAARFLTALVCLGEGCYRLDGVPRMRERPQEALFDALRELGYCLDSVSNRLPVVVHGTGPRPATCCVSVAESSQFASALLLGAARGQWQVNVVGSNPEESPYIRMTRQLIQVFPHGAGSFSIEPDASSGSYFWAANELQRLRFNPSYERIVVADWPTSGWQIDAEFPKFLPLRGTLSRMTDLGDGLLTAVVLAPLAGEPIVFTDLGRLRLQECDRVHALRTELGRCGARVVEQGDTLTVYPSDLHGAIIQTYSDHRIAMGFATLGLHVPGTRIQDPSCVRKTFPNFFQKLAANPPAGLGVLIRNGQDGHGLLGNDLLPG